MTNYVSNIVHNGVEYTIKDSNATNEINNIKTQLTNVNSSGGHQLFDIVMKDHVLSYEETKGFAPLGTYVYKEVISGTSYGYPDFYQKCLDEYQNLNNTTDTVDSVTVTINANGHKFYDIADKATFDNVYAITGEAWYYGIDTTNERIFLPRSTRFKNGSTSDVGEYQDPGLPNISASFKPFITDGSSGTGAIRTTRIQNWTTTGGTGKLDRAQADFDASLSNSIYGASDTVEYSSTKLIPYMCVGDTESSYAAIDVLDITTSENDTLPLGFSTYQGQGTQPSPAWLKSSGQWNSGKVYTTFYNYYIDKIGDDFGAGKVVENTDPYTDYDLVINQTEQTFRLPILDGSEDLPGSVDNRTVLTLGASGDTYTQTKNGYYELLVTSNLSYWYLENTTTGICSGATNAGNGYTSRLFVKAKKNDVVKVLYQLAPTSYDFYFVPAVGNGDLFYKVANAVQNIELLDAGEVLEAVNDLIPNNSSLIASYAMPSQTAVDLTLPTTNTIMTAPADGYVCLGKLASSGQNIYLSRKADSAATADLEISNIAPVNNSHLWAYLPLSKGDKFEVSYTATGQLYKFCFVYAKGSAT